MYNHFKSAFLAILFTFFFCLIVDIVSILTGLYFLTYPISLFTLSYIIYPTFMGYTQLDLLVLFRNLLPFLLLFGVIYFIIDFSFIKKNKPADHKKQKNKEKQLEADFGI